MTSIVEYITQNYFLILFFAVLILLAVIGYFAEKANNSQREKNKEEINNQSDKQNEQRNIEGMIFDSHTGKLVKAEEMNKNEQQTEHEHNTNKYEMRFDPQTGEPLTKNESIEKNSQGIDKTNSNVSVQMVENKDNSNKYEVRFDPQTGEPLNNQEENQNIDKKNSDLNEEQTSNYEIIANEMQPEEQKETSESESFDQFNLEIESLLPKKEIIDTDLLSDIDSLELDKTQKIDLSGVPDLDNIDLPKIKQMTEEEDIWKF